MQAQLKKILGKIKQKYSKLPSDLHITRKAGALVAISEGRPILVEPPKISYCPLFKVLFKTESINQEAISEKFKLQAKNWGMFTSHRQVTESNIVVPFGASEMIMYALRRGGIDASVLVCEGAGSVITSNSELVQGIGAYMNGVLYTTPIEEVRKKLKKQGAILLSDDAEINQFKATRLAYRHGYRKLAVTVRGDQIDQIKKIRDFQLRRCGLEVVILAVCNTGISTNQARIIRDNADLAWACASKPIREIVGPASIIQVGMKIPVFIITEQGQKFLSGYYQQDEVAEFLEDLKSKKYITTNRYQPGGTKLRMGRLTVYAYPTGNLPVNAADQPRPLI